MSGLVQASGHGALMNQTYLRQRYVYDATRKFFLLGRDELIARLHPPVGGRVLEVACGTGRNLAMIGRRHPDTALYGLDISTEMLRSARRKLAEADACSFSAEESFGETGFDRIVLSYCLSIIPDWEAALRCAASHLAPDGQVHIVDFGLQEGLPRWFSARLNDWLARFHVTPQTGLRAAAEAIAAERGLSARWRGLYRSYAQHVVISQD